MRKPTQTGMGQARDEFETAEILLSNQKYQAVCYHSQQCVEKVLKALVLEKAANMPRSHDIVELQNRVIQLGWKITLETDDAVFLNSVYRGRYPSEEGLLPYGEPAKADAERACTAASGVLSSAESVLAQSDLNQPEEPGPHGDPGAAGDP